MTGKANLFIPYVQVSEFLEFLRHRNAEITGDCWFAGPDGPPWVAAIAAERDAASWATHFSLRFGGFCLYLQDVALQVFYNGEFIGAASVQDRQDVFARITGILAIPDMPALQGVLPAPGVYAGHPRPWTRMALLFKTGSDLKLLGNQIDGWTWHRQTTPTAGISILILDYQGAYEAKTSAQWVRALDTTATALVFHEQRQMAWWWFSFSDEPVTGVAKDCAGFVDVWYDLTKLIGEGAGCIRSCP